MSPIQRARQRGTAVILCALIGASNAWGADDDQRIRALERRLETSMRLIEQMSARITELERERAAQPRAAASARAAGAPAVAATAASAPIVVAPEGTGPMPGGSAPPTTAQDNASRDKAIASLQDELGQISEGLARRGYDTGLPLHGFADVDAGTSTHEDPLHLRGFYAGTLDLYLTPQFGDRVRSLAEIAIEYDSDGTSSVDMERLQLGYTVSDSLTLWMGRFHTPFGLWNTAFHHGANLQTSIYRPKFIEFEDRGGIIPAHSVGIWGTGKHDVGPGKVTYDLYVANGPSIRHGELDFNPFTDDNSSKEYGFNLGYQPGGGLRGLSVGLHGLTSLVDSFAVNGSQISQTRLRTAGAYAGYEANDWEMFSEYYRFSNSDDKGIARTSHAGFVHLGRTFGALTPYARYERASLNPNDNYFITQRTGRSYTRFVAGSRYAIDSRSSVKLEFSRSEEAGVTLIDENGVPVPTPRARYSRAAFQYSIAF
jgi:hypothetical protein